MEPEVARWQRKGCGAHSTGKSQGLTPQPALIQDWRQPEAGSWASTTDGGRQAEGPWGSHSEAAECVTVAKGTWPLFLGWERFVNLKQVMFMLGP